MINFKDFIAEQQTLDKHDVLPLTKALNEPSAVLIKASSGTKTAKITPTDKGFTLELNDGTKTKTVKEKLNSRAIGTALEFFGPELRAHLRWDRA